MLPSQPVHQAAGPLGMYGYTNLLLIFFLFALSPPLAAQQLPTFVYAPRAYLCHYAPGPPAIDGDLSDAAWEAVPWTATFTDIEGSVRPEPYYDTRVKMCWDSQYFYIAAELEEPHLWATYSERDMVIFHENDFELFLDPTGDTHHYYELEINALGTVWDLLLTRPYRDGGRAINAWDIAGLQSAVKLYGTLNDPSDEDEKWTLELALPWKVLGEAAQHSGPPKEREIWRANFSRVQWRIEAKENGGYEKTIDPNTNKAYPEHNWVWSPQGAIAMHQPETWGHVQFTKAPAAQGGAAQVSEQAENIRWQLRQLYYQQKAYYREHGYYAKKISQVANKKSPIRLWAAAHHFLATYEADGLQMSIREDGLIR